MSAKKILQNLRTARSLILPREQWVQGYEAVDSKHERVEGTDPEAVAWCTIGALGKACPTDFQLFETLDFLRGYLPEGYQERSTSISEFNDTHTHEEVIQLFNRGIAAIEGSIILE